MTRCSTTCMHQGQDGSRAVPCRLAAAAGGKDAAGLPSEREWKAATGAAKVGRWLASIPHPAPPRSAYVSFVPPVTLLEKLLLLRSVPAARIAISKLAKSYTAYQRAKYRHCVDCPNAAGTMFTMVMFKMLQCYRCLLCKPSKQDCLSLQYIAMSVPSLFPKVDNMMLLELGQYFATQ